MTNLRFEAGTPQEDGPVEDEIKVQELKFRYVGEEPSIAHPDLGLLTHDTPIQPSSFEVAEALKHDARFELIVQPKMRGKKG